MARATQLGQYERCIQLREQIKVAKRQEIQQQIDNASRSGQFEVCIRLQQEMSRII